MLGDNHVVDVYISKIEAVKAAVSIGGIILRTHGTVYAQFKLSRKPVKL